MVNNQIQYNQPRKIHEQKHTHTYIYICKSITKKKINIQKKLNKNNK